MNVDDGNPHDRLPQRRALLVAEQERRDKYRPDSDWDADEWFKLLTALMNREQASDDLYQQEIAQAEAIDQLDPLYGQFDHAIRSDVEAYGHLLAWMRDWREMLEGLDQSEINYFKTLTRHITVVEARQIDRQTFLRQVWMEQQERRRMLNGRLKEESWLRYWDRLTAIFREQDWFYQQSDQGSGLAEALNERILWLRKLRRMQQDTAYSWRNRVYFDTIGHRVDTFFVTYTLFDYSWRDRLIGASIKTLGMVVLGALMVLSIRVMLPDSVERSTYIDTPSTPSTSAVLPTITPYPQQADGSDLPQNITAEELNVAGVALLRDGRCQEAIPKFTQATILNPLFYEPRNNIAFCLYDQGLVELAIVRWQEALALNPFSPDANAGLGMAFYARGNIDAGRRYYTQAIQLEPRYCDAGWLKQERLWSDRAIHDSRELRVLAVR